MSSSSMKSFLSSMACDMMWNREPGDSSRAILGILVPPLGFRGNNDAKYVPCVARGQTVFILLG